MAGQGRGPRDPADHRSLRRPPRRARLFRHRLPARGRGPRRHRRASQGAARDAGGNDPRRSGEEIRSARRPHRRRGDDLDREHDHRHLGPPPRPGCAEGAAALPRRPDRAGSALHRQPRARHARRPCAPQLRRLLLRLHGSRDWKRCRYEQARHTHPSSRPCASAARRSRRKT